MKSKKKLIIIGSIIAVVVIVLAIVLIPSKFDIVENKCVKIAGLIDRGNNSFTIETIPDMFDDALPSSRDLMLKLHKQKALDAIKYANEELGFPGIYSKMMNTTALMGRQSEENSKYIVTWTYNQEDGLTVTYSKKH